MTESIKTTKVNEKMLRRFKIVLSLTKASYIALIILITSVSLTLTLLIFLTPIPIATFVAPLFGLLSFIGLPIATLCCLLFGLLSTKWINNSDGLLQDNGYTKPALTLTGIIIIATIVLVIIHFLCPFGNISGSSTNEKNEVGAMKDIFKIITVDKGLKLQELDKWNEIVQEVCESDHWEHEYCDIDTEHYALNAQALRSDIKIPPDMVLFFPAVLGKNQIGGKELFRKDGANVAYILLADYTLARCRIDNLDSLRWEQDDQPFTAGNHISWLYTACIALIVIALIYYRQQAYEMMISIILITPLSALFGGLMGGFSEFFLYNANNIFGPYPGLKLNIGFGLGASVWTLAGIYFILITPLKIKNIREKYKAIFGYLTMYGAIYGLVASLVFNMLLTYYYDEFHYANFAAGSVFGIATGLCISALFTTAFLKIRPDEELPSTELHAGLDGGGGGQDIVPQN